MHGGILNRASLPSATRGWPRVSPQPGVSLWLPGRGAGDTHRGLPGRCRCSASWRCCSAAAVPRSGAGGPGVGPGPEAGQLTGKGCPMPGPNQPTPTFLLLPFSSVATGLFSPPDEGDGERGFGGLQQGRGSGLPLGELARLAGWIETIFVYTGCQCLLCLCVSHTHPLSQTPSHIPLSCCPSGFSRFPALPPSPGAGCSLARLWLTLRITHSFKCTAHPHCCPAHTHTHPYCSGTVSCTLTHSVSLSLHSCAHLHTHTPRHLLISVPTSQLLLSCRGQGHAVGAIPSCEPPHLIQPVLPMRGPLAPSLTHV